MREKKDKNFREVNNVERDILCGPLKPFSGKTEHSMTKRRRTVNSPQIATAHFKCLSSTETCKKTNWKKKDNSRFSYCTATNYVI